MSFATDILEQAKEQYLLMGPCKCQWCNGKCIDCQYCGVSMNGVSLYPIQAIKESMNEIFGKNIDSELPKPTVVEKISCSTNQNCLNLQLFNFNSKPLRKWLLPFSDVPKTICCLGCGTERKPGEGVTIENNSIYYYGSNFPRASKEVDNIYIEYVNKIRNNEPGYIHLYPYYDDETVDYAKDYDDYCDYLYGCNNCTAVDCDMFGGYDRYSRYLLEIQSQHIFFEQLASVENRPKPQSTYLDKKLEYQKIIEEAISIRWAAQMRKEFFYYRRCEKYSKYVREILELVAENENEFDEYRSWSIQHGYISYLLFRHDNDRKNYISYNKTIKRLKYRIYNHHSESFPENVWDIFQGIVDEAESINELITTWNNIE